ncbi:MAG: hypoxanthine-guanine phosphoribosyltransferase [Methylococcales bacterium]|nr:hypoxanthine-guanine phosphoribosyltransferase [Methylococcales bacterium]MCK5477637.1 hypoxanthine-guanine phosphoribosyltransferase [Methylococcales bacterium]
MFNEVSHIESSADLLHDESEVETAIDKMAEKINYLLNDRNPVFLSVMNGGVVIAGKLLTRLNFPLTFDAINASRYLNNTSGGEIQWIQKPETNLKDRTVLIVDDILDKGLTLEAIIDYCKDQGATSVYTAVLVDKKLDYKKPVIADFVGLKVENRYLFGYGMDYKGYLRNASGIYACKDEEIQV